MKLVLLVVMVIITSSIVFDQPDMKSEDASVEGIVDGETCGEHQRCMDMQRGFCFESAVCF